MTKGTGDPYDSSTAGIDALRLEDEEQFTVTPGTTSVPHSIWDLQYSDITSDVDDRQTGKSSFTLTPYDTNANKITSKASGLVYGDGFVARVCKVSSRTISSADPAGCDSGPDVSVSHSHNPDGTYTIEFTINEEGDYIAMVVYTNSAGNFVALTCSGMKTLKKFFASSNVR